MSGRSPQATLGDRGRRLWRAVLATYDLSRHEREILLDACRTADLLEALTLAATDTPVLESGRIHPAVAEVRHQRDLLGRLLARLALPDEDDELRTGAARLGQRGGRARARTAQQRGGR